MNAALTVLALVVAALLLPARFDPAIWLKERSEKRSEVDQ